MKVNMTILQNKIKEWESTSIVGDGDSYAPVTQDDIDSLYDIVLLLLESKYKPDGDGDYPIDFTCRDKNKYKWIVHPIFNQLDIEAKPLDIITTLSSMIKDISQKLERESILLRLKEK